MSISETNTLPRGWSIVKLGNIIEFNYGKGLVKSKRIEHGLIPVFGSNGIVGYHDKFLIDVPSIIVGRKGAAGEVHLSQAPCWAIDTTYFIIPPSQIDLVFLFYQLRQLNLKQLDKSTAIPGLNRDDAYKKTILLPPLLEQHRIVAKIEELFTKLDAGIAVLKTAKAQIKRYRQSVLKAAFEGKLTEEWRKNNKPTESAEELLSKIKDERKKAFLLKRKVELKKYVEIKTKSASVSNLPNLVLKDFIIEMVVNDFDLTNKLVDKSIKYFPFEIFEEGNLKNGAKSFLHWITQTDKSLSENGIESGILKAYRNEWLRYAEEELNPNKTRRTFTPVFSSDGSYLETRKDWAELEIIKTSLSHHIRETYLVKPAVNEWEKQEAKRKTTEIDTTNLPQLPEGWEWSKLQFLTTTLGDGLHGTPNYSDDGEYFFINGNNLVNGKIEIKADTKKIKSDEFEKYKKTLNDYTVLVSINGTIGKTAFYNNENVILGKSACYFNLYKAIDKRYVRYILISQRFTDYTNKTATGSTIKNVPLSAMREFEIPIPCGSEEQNQIVSEIERHFSVADEAEKNIDRSLKQAERLRQSILKEAFEGRLVPQDPTDEPAAVLLERIKAEKNKMSKGKK